MPVRKRYEADISPVSMVNRHRRTFTAQMLKGEQVSASPAPNYQLSIVKKKAFPGSEYDGLRQFVCSLLPSLPRVSPLGLASGCFRCVASCGRDGYVRVF